MMKIENQENDLFRITNELENNLIQLEVIRDLLANLFDVVDPVAIKKESDALALYSALQKLKYTHNLLFILLENLDVYIQRSYEQLRKGTLPHRKASL
ncbi:hypothetical protein Marpi_2126 (plasmid) [Marinitoga piezophila KA3]|uniref:Uncharacterized protein n=1 Tax=Marinitoga piezophila (strain DSM 14283 / JCM 11233 / KA3) TaxID=443254 RepID=H2J8G8_MARPK|nr:hypothetical protein [Marinitoga piezophila]AEX86499.1 hypothetical protein Marpi_2126 [Marinitoga piezophila KA3]